MAQEDHKYICNIVLTVDFEPSDSLTPCQSAILPSRWGEWIVMVPKIHISQYVRGNNEFPQNILFNDLSFITNLPFTILRSLVKAPSALMMSGRITTRLFYHQ